MDPKLGAAGDAPDEKLEQYQPQRQSELRPDEAWASRAPGGMDFITANNKIDETYHLPVGDARKSTW